MVRIIADNVVCSLSYKNSENSRTSILHVPMIIDGVVYKELSPNEFSKIQGKTISTSSINQSEYKEKIRELSQYEEPIIIFSHSSRLGGSYNNATVVLRELKEELNNLNAELFEIGTVFAAGSLLVKKTSELSERLPYEDVIEELKRLIPRAKMYVCVCLDEIGSVGISRLPPYVSRFLSKLISPLHFYHVFSIGDGGKISLPRLRPYRKIFDADESLINSLVDDIKKYTSSTVEIMVNHTDYTFSYDLALKLEENIKNRLEKIGINVVSHGAERFSSVVQNQAGQKAHGAGILCH